MKEKIFKLRLEGKSLNEISKLLNCSKSTVSYHCNSEVRENFRRRRRINRRKQLTELKTLHGGKCNICGYNRCLNALHFHHLDTTTKIGEVGSLFNEKGKAAAFEEAKKCQLICANCHAELHTFFPK